MGCGRLRGIVDSSARAAFLIKPFTGLHLAVSQLSAELRRAGHETRVIYFKKYLAVPSAREAEYRTTTYQ